MPNILRCVLTALACVSFHAGAQVLMPDLPQQHGLGGGPEDKHRERADLRASLKAQADLSLPAHTQESTATSTSVRLSAQQRALLRKQLEEVRVDTFRSQP